MTHPNQLIFLISQPRAGSTMLQKLISNHPKIGTTSEPWIMLPFLSFLKEGRVQASYRQNIANRAIKDYFEKKKLNSVYRESLRSFLLDLYVLQEGEVFFLDKTPRYYEILHELINTFPEARFILLKRNPFDVLNSMLNTWAPEGLTVKHLSTFSRDFMEAPFAIQSFLDKNAEKDNVKVIRYEQLLDNRQASLSEVMEWLGLELMNDQLEPGANTKVKGIFGDDVYSSNTKSELITGNTDKWTESMQDKKIREFMYGYAEFLGDDFIKKYGYLPPNVKLKPLDSKRTFNQIMEEVGNPYS